MQFSPRNPTIEQLQSKIDKVQRHLKGRSAIIAGGALRDIILGKPIKDIDVFIEGGGPFEHFDELHEFLFHEFVLGVRKSDGLAWNLKQEVLSTRRGYANNTIPKAIPGMTSEPAATDYANFWVVEYPVGWYGYPVQFVWLTDSDPRKEVFEKFDFALCRVWLDSRRLRWSPEFAADRESKRLTLFDSGWGSTAPDRVERLRAKFSDYRFVNRSTQYKPNAQTKKD
jgi:hypothetical protein